MDATGFCQLCGPMPAVHGHPLLLICAGHPAQDAGGGAKAGGVKGREEGVEDEGESKVHRALEGGSGMGKGSQAGEKHRGRGLLAWPCYSVSRLAEEALQQCLADLHCWSSCCCWLQPATLSGDKEQRQERRERKEASRELPPATF